VDHRILRGRRRPSSGRDVDGLAGGGRVHGASRWHRSVLEVHGIGLASTPWLKALGDGLHEFRVRHDASTIEGLAGHEPADGLPTQKKILLRLFVHFHGNKVVLLVHGYDKGSNDSPRQQGKEIQEARKRLTRWRVAEAKRAKKK
jgi:hypothetical protein